MFRCNALANVDLPSPTPTWGDSARIQLRLVSTIAAYHRVNPMHLNVPFRGHRPMALYRRLPNACGNSVKDGAAASGSGLSVIAPRDSVQIQIASDAPWMQPLLGPTAFSAWLPAAACVSVGVLTLLARQLGSSRKVRVGLSLDANS